MTKRIIADDSVVSALPGPIALVTTVDANGNVNVAPKSWISVITGRPVRYAVGCNRGHHTAQNLLATGECVLNFPADDLAERAWAAHVFREPGPDELAARGLTPVPAFKVRPPLIAECKAHIEARLEQVLWYGDECVLILVEVAVSADEAACEAPDPWAVLRPIFYLKPGTFGVIDHANPVGRPRTEEDDTRYVITLTRKPDRQLTPDLIRAHVAHLQRLDEQGRLVLCGPFADGEGGMVIVRAASLEEARSIAEADPFVASGAETCQVRQWALSNRANNHMGFGD